MTSIELQARKSLRELILHVFIQSNGELSGITYQELAKRIHRLNKYGEGHGHGMGKVLGVMGHLLQDLEGEWGETIPHIQSLVINKAGSLKGLPDEGIEEFWSDYPDLNKKEKQLKVLQEYQRIFAFGSRWNKVLSDLREKIVVKNEGSGILHMGKSSGESQSHKNLKKYIIANPHIVGADFNYSGFIEYSLPSLDELDVFFKSPQCWIAVEVKSRVSENLEQDYERGLYQCVKYRAILEAMRHDPVYKTPADIRVFLVLEKSLPEKYRTIARALEVRVLEDIKVS